MKEFVTAARASEEAPEPLEFKLDGVALVMNEPSESQLTQLMLIEASETRTADQIAAGQIDFAMALFDADSRATLKRRLFDFDDNFTHEDLLDIVKWAIEVFADRPTKPSSGSTSSPENGGENSMATSPSEASASSTSESLAPAT